MVVAIRNRVKVTVRPDSGSQLTNFKSFAACKRPANTRSASQSEGRSRQPRSRASKPDIPDTGYGHNYGTTDRSPATRGSNTQRMLAFGCGNGGTPYKSSALLYLRKPFLMDWLSLSISYPMRNVGRSEIVPRTESLPTDGIPDCPLRRNQSRFLNRRTAAQSTKEVQVEGFLPHDIEEHTNVCHRKYGTT